MTSTIPAISAAPITASVKTLAHTETARNFGIGSIAEMKGGNINIITINVSNGETAEQIARRVASILGGRSDE